MTDSNANTLPSSPSSSAPPTLFPAKSPLIRPYQNRVFAGVCRGLSLHLGIRTWIIRLIFVAFAFLGVGILAYLLLWIMIPSGYEPYPGATTLPVQQTALSYGNAPYSMNVPPYGSQIYNNQASAPHTSYSQSSPASPFTAQKVGTTFGNAFAPGEFSTQDHRDTSQSHMSSNETIGTDPHQKMSAPVWNFMGMGVAGLVVIYLGFTWMVDHDILIPSIAAEIALAALCGLGVWIYFERSHTGYPVATIIALLVFIFGMFAIIGLSFTRGLVLPIFGIFVIGIFSTAIMVAPWLASSHQKLAHETAQKEREEERADMAAHLHDSVLQTLNLIRQNATNSAMVAQLAHTQERELRRWLYEDREDAIDSLSSSMKLISARVEDTFGVPIDVITVGDTRPTERINAIIEATQQALTNACIHGKPQISLYVECTSHDVQAFVRDHGDGFDITSIPQDRMGIRHSIIGRVERAGGKVKIVSRPGWGTEVRMTLPLDEQ
ncbi:ATP-binding protein [Alloscardovia theropitheci]|nr:ATP-binding protein [Alloscardovia theropitheci]